MHLLHFNNQYCKNNSENNQHIFDGSFIDHGKGHCHADQLYIGSYNCFGRPTLTPHIFQSHNTARRSR